ncbi:EamA family transporter [Vulcanisaeta distributa]|uniref:EamA family transporter n=1 Tax=Vulcanisaeta distributa TaxID=164451 RepID=UPI001FB1F3DF|nr:EamA family transporter [Vulcanisaeta distributa]
MTYLALRLFHVNELITLSYLFSTVALLIVSLFHGYDEKSIIDGLLLSPINYVIVYLYTELSGGVGGLTALMSSSYIIPLIVLDYVNNRNVNARYLVSAITLLGALYLLFQGYNDSIYVALLLMVMNLVYTIVLARVNDIDITNFVFGQSLGTLLISYLMIRNPSALTLSLDYLYYPLILALVGNVIPYILYVESIRQIGPVETSLTSSMETISSLIASLPIQQLPTNPVAWVLLAISILSLNVELSRSNVLRRPQLMSYRLPIQVNEGSTSSLNMGGFGNHVILINPHLITRIIGKRKVI